jgi:hypothetical protein
VLLVGYGDLHKVYLTFLNAISSSDFCDLNLFDMANIRSNGNGLEPVDTNMEYVDLKDTGLHIEEVAIARLTDEQVFELSKESLRFKSWTTFRITLIMIVQGCNQAGYGKLSQHI